MVQKRRLSSNAELNAETNKMSQRIFLFYVSILKEDTGKSRRFTVAATVRKTVMAFFGKLPACVKLGRRGRAATGGMNGRLYRASNR